MNQIFLQIYDAIITPPQLVNTDGDPILLHELSYEIDNPEEVFQALSSLCVTEDEASLRELASLDKLGTICKIQFPWTRRGHRLDPSADNTVLGDITIDGNRMTIAVNSKERAKKIQREVKLRLGNRARPKGIEIIPPESLKKRGRSKNRGRAESESDFMNIPQVKEQIGQMMAQNWGTWIDKHIPTLDGKTPREAVETRDGRESVEALLLDAERHARRDKHLGEFEHACIKDVSEKLGLDRS